MGNAEVSCIAVPGGSQDWRVQIQHYQLINVEYLRAKAMTTAPSCSTASTIKMKIIYKKEYNF